MLLATEIQALGRQVLSLRPGGESIPGFSLFWLLMVFFKIPGHPWAGGRPPPVSASGSTWLHLCVCLSSDKNTIHHGLGPTWPQYDLLLNFVTSAKILLSNNVLFTGLGGQDLGKRNLPKIGVFAAESQGFGWLITGICRAALSHWPRQSV